MVRKRYLPNAVWEWGRRRHNKSDRGSVYFITDGEAIKIGHSIEPEWRRHGLQVSNHRPLKIIASFRGTLSEENDIQRRFNHLKISGEWFQMSPEIFDFIAELETFRPLMQRCYTTITEILNGKAHLVRRNLAMVKDIPQAERKYLDWLSKAKFSDDVVAKQAERCGLHIQCLAMNLPDPGPALVKFAQADFAKLEAMLSRSQR